MPRLVRDRITWLVYAQLGVWGYFLYGFGPVVPLLRREQDTTAAVASLHSTGLAIGNLIGGLLFPTLVRRFGRGTTLWLSLAGVVAATGAFCLFRPLPATLASTVVAAMFGTMVVSGTITTLSEHHGAAGSAAISEANAAAAGAGVLAPLVIGAAVRAGLGWRPALFVVAGLVALVALAALAFRVRVPPGSGFVGPRQGVDTGPRYPTPPTSIEPALAMEPVGPPPVAPASVSAQASRRLPLPYWLAWAMMGVTGAVEVCLSLWAAEVLRTHVGMSAGGASAAVASIVGGMFVGRLIGGRIALRMAPVRLLIAAFGLSAIGFTLFWATGVAWLSVAGLVVIGLGNAMHYPLAISMAVVAAGGQADKAAAYSSYSVAVGFGLGPLALGWIADLLGSSHQAFLVVPGLLVAATALAVLLERSLAAPAVTEAARTR